MGASWWASDLWSISPVLLVSWVVWVIGSIILHELSHGWAAIRCGDDTPIVTGHMTWNPRVHMGDMALVVFAVIGITWGAMPVNPHRFKGRYDDALVSAAGPAMNLSLALIASVATAIWLRIGAGLPIDDHVHQNVYIFLRTGAALNIFLMLFNLVPVPPLDGSRILSSVSPAFARLEHSEHGPMIALVAFVGLFFFGADYLFGAAFSTADFVIDLTMIVLP